MDAEAPLRKPSLADTFADIDRRIRTVEFGDPNSVADARRRLADVAAQLADIHSEMDAMNQQITTLDQAVASLSGQLGVVHDSSIARDNTLHGNDNNLYTWLTAYAPPLRTWTNTNLPDYIIRRSDWAVAYHNYAFHTQANPGAAPNWTTPPATPAWPIITDPTP